MSAEIGLASLWMAAALALLTVLVGFAIVPLGDAAARIALLRRVAMLQALLTLSAFAALMVAFATTDLSVRLVAENSHVDKPMLYKLAGTWGNHEGSMLLWVTILTLAGGAMALLARRIERDLLAIALGAQSALALGFFAFLLLVSNPFARLDPAPVAGMGLNPLLQDPGLAVHPPTLYIGYVGLSVAFSLAVAALVTGEVGPAFARAVRPWVLGAWVFLTLGITAGSYWAYYDLGWGGWWFWDPVENASLMPWLAATALLHSVNVLATRDALRAWTIMLSLVAFAMSMVGTFLVRSGVLTSVHAFAIDPRRGSFILALLVLYIGVALALFALRIGTVRQGATFTVASREAGLVLNNLLLSCILGVVLIGTLYPIVAEAFFGVRLSVGGPYFDRAAVPFALVLMAALIVAPSLRWRRDRLARVTRPIVLPIAVGVVAVVATAALAPAPGLLPTIGLGLGVAVLVGSILPLWGRRLAHVPLPLFGMVLAHAGVGVAAIGMASDALFTHETLASLSVGQAATVGPWLVRLRAIDPVLGPNWTGIAATLDARRTGAGVTLVPASRSFQDPPMTTSESAIATRWDGQLYTVLAAPDNPGDVRASYQLRLWWKPFVTLIWAGGALIALGGLMALGGRAWAPWVRIRRARRGGGYAR